MSRGRGIILFKNLIEILDHINNKETQWIAQKYIENQLIVKKRKFDIRQWVLVESWNPLTVWVYAEPYIRFPCNDYTDDELTDVNTHLTNNSIGKGKKSDKATFDIEGNMWSAEELQEYLLEDQGWDIYEEKIKEAMQNAVIHSLESVQDMFECKQGCFELFGYDFMIDDDFNVWLIEINSSPAMDYSTPVTERLVQKGSEDIIKVVVDYASTKGEKNKAKVDTGGFTCVYRASRIVDKPMKSFGLSLLCEGKKISHKAVALM